MSNQRSNPAADGHASLSGRCDVEADTLRPAVSVRGPDGVIDHPDGTVEYNGYFFEINWDELDPPEGHPDAEEVPHEEVVTEMCELLGLPPGSLG